jgi:Response receiver domain
MTKEEYREFLSEAFIQPLRSVLIVDDDYPTFEDMLVIGDPTPASKAKLWHKDPDRVVKMLQEFRDAEPPLIVDIHDGRNVEQEDETKVAGHLHQSDLLILDFQLERDQPEDGSKAIGIVRTLFSNDHFNLVVLHSSTDQDIVFTDLLLGLLHPIEEFLDDEDRTGVVVRIGELEDEDPGLLKRLLATIGDDHYLAFRENGARWPIAQKRNPPPTKAFEEEAERAGFKTKLEQIHLGKYLLELRQKALSKKLSPVELPGLDWRRKDKPWIRTDSGFIALSDKEKRRGLLVELLDALESWGPPPSRLFLSRLRAQIDRVGVPAESKALENKYVLARWYSELLASDPDELETRIQDAVNRHADLLFRQVAPGVGEYASRVLAADKQDAAQDHCKRYFDVDFADANESARAIDEYNCFVCSRTPSMRHLETGHLFAAEDRVWVCLTPLCDLVPGRRKLGSDRFGQMDGIMPFMAVRLQPIGATKTKPTSNRFIYVKIGGELKAFTLAVKDGGNPHWFNLYALNEGRFRDGGFDYRRVELNGRGDLAPKKVRATVIGQLQYEYALNLMQRLGFSMTRVGLDFVKRTDDEDE